MLEAGKRRIPAGEADGDEETPLFLTHRLAGSELPDLLQHRQNPTEEEAARDIDRERPPGKRRTDEMNRGDADEIAKRSSERGAEGDEANIQERTHKIPIGMEDRVREVHDKDAAETKNKKRLGRIVMIANASLALIALLGSPTVGQVGAKVERKRQRL